MINWVDSKMKLTVRLGFDDLVSRFSADRVIKSGRDVIPNRIGGVANHKIMNTFSEIASDLIASNSINNLNRSASKDPITVTTNTETKGILTSVSSDGKLSGPISKPITYTKVIDDQVIQKTQNDGNTIKFGSKSYKDEI